MDSDVEDDLVERLLRWRFSDPDPIERSGANCYESSDSEDDDLGKERPSLNGRRRIYTNAFKLRVVEAARAGSSITVLADMYGVRCPSSIHAWLKLESMLRAACTGNQGSNVSLGGQGRRAKFKHEDDVRQWIKDMRREGFPLKTIHVVEFLKEEFEGWTAAYLRVSRDSSLHRLVRRIVRRNGFSFRKPSQSLLSIEELLQEHVAYTSTVGVAVMKTYARGCTFNTDETGVYFDESPGLIIADRGKRGGTKVKGKKHSFRATVLLTVAADGTKLPPLVVFKAKPGGTVEDSLVDYPKGAFYAVQKKAWMDKDVWKKAFIEGVWADYCQSEDREPLALYVDNFKAHVSDESVADLAAYGTEVVTLPPNTTAVLQPLDVGLMGPFKMRLRTLALSAELAAVRGEPAEKWPRRNLRERLLLMRKMSSEEKRRAVAKKVIQAWDSVSENNVRKAWAKSGLYTEATE